MPKSTAKPKIRTAKSRPKKRTRSVAAAPTKQKKRQVAAPAYKSFRMSKRIRHERPHITGSFRLFKRAITTLLKRKRLFIGLTLTYLVLTIVLVKGLGVGSNIAELKETLVSLFGGSLSKLITTATLFGTLLSNAGSVSSEQAGSYQTVLLITTSLAIIWALRQTLSPDMKKVKLTALDAFYKGLYPLVPFLLVLLVIGLQLLPAVLANFLYTVVFGGGLAVTIVEKLLWSLILILIITLSLYMITSSIFALYIVTLPDMRPMQALRSARELVRNRRWTIVRKLLFLPVALLLISAAITIPIILLSPMIAEWVFFVLSMLGLVVLHSYLYALYRELL